MIRTATVSIEELLAHSAWVRELAQRLVADAATADDMVQEAWVAALSRPPLRGVPLRPWLARVVHNATRMSLRAAARRTARERIAAREEALSSAHASVEQAELHAGLVHLLLAVDEPYRTTLILRYFESLPPRRIAARLAVPVETVHTRLQRGLQRLRRELEKKHGDTAWLAACLPLARAPQAWTTGALGWISMNLKLPLAVCAAAVIGALAWIGLRHEGEAASRPGSAPEPIDVASAPPAAHEGASAAPGTLPAETERAPAAFPQSAPTAAVETASAAKSLRGKVIDDLGRPLAGILMALEGPGGAELARTTSAAGGEFAFEGVQGGRIVEAEEALCTVLCGAGHVDTRERPAVVVAARGIALAGRVVDELGVPLAGARVRAPLPEGFRGRFREVLDHSAEVPVEALTDARGEFRFDSVALLESARLQASLDQFEPYDEELPAASDVNLVIALRRTLATDGTVRGQVVDAANLPVAGAKVALGVAAQTADADGKFVFLLEDEQSANARYAVAPRTLKAVKPGFLPAVFEPALAQGVPQWPASVTLRLLEETLQIHGRVVGSTGDPIPGARVFISEAALFGAGEEGPIVLENLLADAAEGPTWRFTESDERGYFTIDGLLPREYRLRAMDMETLLIAESEPVLAGGVEEIELELDTASLYPRVAGRLVGGDGKPVAHARVRPMCDAFRVKHEQRTVSTSHGGLQGTTTDAEGRFELKNVPRSLVYLRIDGEEIVPLEYGRYVEGDTRFLKSVRELPREKIEDLEITVGRRCHFQVELVDPGFADEVAVLDGEGEPVELSVFSGNSRREGRRQPLQGGRSEVIACPDTGAMVVLKKAGAEVSRRKLELKAGEVTLVRF